MNRKATLVFTFLFFNSFLFCQNYLMESIPITDCGGFFLDSGGGANPYSPNESFTTLICPDSTTGTHVQLIFSGTQLGAGDEMCFFDGITDQAPSLGCVSDFDGASTFIIQATAPNPTGCLTLVFNSDATDEGAGWSADINCIPACQLIEAVLETTDPAVNPTDTGWIDICPGDAVFFSGKGLYPQNGLTYNHSDSTSTFEWSFGDGTFATDSIVSHVFSEPGGYVVQLAITDQLGCRSANFITQRVRVSTFPTFAIGGDVPEYICADDTVQLNAVVNQIDAAHVVSVLPNEGDFLPEGSRSDSLALPDGDGASYQTSIVFSNFAPGQVLTNINDLTSICVVMEHSWMRDLEITLTCPSGESVILHNHPGHIGGEVFLGVPFEADEGFIPPIPGQGAQYCWTPDATAGTWIEFANANLPPTLPPGDYNSFEPLTNFLGCPLNGEWTIKVQDLWAIDNGYIFSWGINFNPDLYPVVETFTPNFVAWDWKQQPSIFFQTLDSIAASPPNAGSVSYTFEVTDDFGCTFDTMVNLQVLPFSHPDCHTCQEYLPPEADTSVCQGEPVNLNVAVPLQTDIPLPFETFPNAQFGASNHPPGNPLNSAMEVVAVNPPIILNPILEILSVCVDIETDFDADLQLFLEAPDGSVFELSTNNGGGGDNYSKTCFTPTATESITAGTPPFTGNFQPEGNWNTLIGAPANGFWMLRVSDANGTDMMSKLKWWSITFNTSNEVTYTWSPAADLSCIECPDPVAMPFQTTTYTVESLDSYNCADSVSMTIGVFASYDAPVASCNIDNVGTAVLNWTEVGPNLDYEVNVNGMGWEDANNGNLSHAVSGFVNGDMVNFEVRVKTNSPTCGAAIGTSSCQFLDCQLLAFPSVPPPYQNLCFGQCDASVPISVVNGVSPFTYTATHLPTGTVMTQDSGLFVGLCEGAYRLIVGDAIGCLDTVDFVVEGVPLLRVQATQLNPVSCAGGNDGSASAAVMGGSLNPGSSYNIIWNDPLMQIGNTAVNLPAGNYEVMVMDDNGCTATAMVAITEPAPISLEVTSADALCKGESSGSASVVATGGAGGYAYQWSTGATPSQSSTGGLPAGLVTVMVEDSNGCAETGSVTIGEPASNVSIQLVQTDTSCFGQSKSAAMAIPSGGTGSNYIFAWSPFGQTTQTISGLTPINYTVTVTDENGCTSENTIQVVDYPALTVSNPQFTPPDCPGMANGQAGVSITIGGFDNCSSGCQFEWSNGLSGSFISGLPGNQTYSVTVTDNRGCRGEGATFIPDPDPITFETDATDVNCFGAADGTASVVNVSGAKGLPNFQWDANANNQTTAQADNLPAGNFTVLVTDTLGCTASASVSVGQPSQIQVSFDVIDNKCFADFGGAISANVSGGIASYSYLWSNNSTTSKIDNLAAGTYTLTVTDGNGCPLVSSAEVSAPGSLTASVQVQNVSCFGGKDGAITIETQGGIPPFSFSLDGVNFSASNTLIGLAAGDYAVQIKDGNGCVGLEFASVQSPDEFTIATAIKGEETDDYTLNLGDSVRVWIRPTNNQGGRPDYFWSASFCGTLRCNDSSLNDCDESVTCNGPFTKPQNPVTYKITAVDAKGCEAETTVFIRVRKERMVLVPTGFAPNGKKAENHALHVHGKEGTTVKTFRIFDRWGEMLYEGADFAVNDLEAGWDGTFKGQDMPSGVYVWYLVVEYVDGLSESFQGETTLIR